eukprot:4108085-Pyramimonas_sp.AAC.1
MATVSQIAAPQGLRGLILDASRIPTSPSRNESQESGGYEGSGGACRSNRGEPPYTPRGGGCRRSRRRR